MYIRHIAYNIDISSWEQLKPFDASNKQFFKDFRPFRRSSQKKGEKSKCNIEFCVFIPPDCLFFGTCLQKNRLAFG